MTDIVLCGVGGQGTVLASKLIAAAAMDKGLYVTSAETIGMAQKGGSVFSHLRVGKEVGTPMIARGTADLIIAFEPAEAVRMLPFLRRDGRMIVNSHAVKPVTSVLKDSGYDGREMIDYLKKNVDNLTVIDCERACREILQGHEHGAAGRRRQERGAGLHHGRDRRNHEKDCQAAVPRSEHRGPQLQGVIECRLQRNSWHL